MMNGLIAESDPYVVGGGFMHIPTLFAICFL